ncbi:MAG TPA: HAMP domain-containing sensor histidine kinase [Acidimicrobiales bacterium]|jgi:two-component system sensor histidine kinase BaeS
MRRRLMLALMGLVAGVLVIAVVGSLILSRHDSRNQARSQLVTEAQSLTSGKADFQSVAALKVVRRVLKLEDALFVRVDLAGQIVSPNPLPSDLTASELQPEALLSGQTVSGWSGNEVFAAAPITLNNRERTRLKLRGEIAVVLTRPVGNVGPSWGYFLLVGGVALVVAAGVAWQMSRRMARPLVEATAATGRIASGDLEGRVPVREGDYTEFSSLVRSINEMAQSLQNSRTRERDLLLSVSHDLRTPLTSIRGFAEAITDGAIEDTRQAAEVITSEAGRLERLVGDLLDLTKLEASQLSINLRSTDVTEVVSTTTEGFRPMAERNGVALTSWDPPMQGSGERPPNVLADPDRLAQLLANLLENAISFANTMVSVAVHAPAPGEQHVSITVDDDGPGIAPGDLARVFQRFYRTDRGPRRQVGSGLGLAIVSELATAMGGTVHAESPAPGGTGSRFVVTLGRPT